jgi:hypothetical protein
MTRLLALVTSLLLSLPLQASNDERLREANFPALYQLDQVELKLKLKNQSVLSYLWVDVYAAALYAAPQMSARQALGARRSMRLELYYFRDIDREDVIEAAWVTLRRQHDTATLGRLRKELDALHASFRDIRPGDRYALTYAADSGLSLERNGEIAFTSRNSELANAYLGIWLAPGGLSERLRDKLLAESPQ